MASTESLQANEPSRLPPKLATNLVFKPQPVVSSCACATITSCHFFPGACANIIQLQCKGGIGPQLKYFEHV